MTTAATAISTQRDPELLGQTVIVGSPLYCVAAPQILQRPNHPSRADIEIIEGQAGWRVVGMLPSIVKQIGEAIDGNANNPCREFMYGAAGIAVASLAMWRETGDAIGSSALAAILAAYGRSCGLASTPTA